MRRLILLTAIVIAVCAFAMQGAKEITVWVDGTRIQFDDTTPVMRSKRVLVPLRGVFQALGATVNWDSATKIITAQKEGYDIELSLNRTEATVNGKSVILDVPAQMVSDRVVVPLRFVGEALGAFVKWESQTGAVLIQTVPPPLFLRKFAQILNLKLLHDAKKVPLRLFFCEKSGILTVGSIGSALTALDRGKQNYA